MTGSGDLEGILVVSLEQAVAAPHATARLADAGARVIKVERPDGDFARGYDRAVHGESSFFVWLNRGKESICLDLKSASDMAVMEAMLARADIFVQNLAPGAAERLGLGAQTLRDRNPGLIHVSISGYGSDGPLRDQKAYDFLIQGESGLLSVSGDPDSPGRVGISVCDIAAGETAYSGILQALIGRGRTGRGRALDISLFHTMADWMNVPYLLARHGAGAPKRVGLKHPSIAPYGAFRCADGSMLLMAVQSDREWRAFCESALQRPGLADDPRFATNVDRVAHRAEVDAIVGGLIGTLDREEAMALLGKAGIACGRLSSVEDLTHHPQARTRNVEAGGTALSVMDRGCRDLDARLPEPAKVPALDEHGPALRAEFGP